MSEWGATKKGGRPADAWEFRERYILYGEDNHHFFGIGLTETGARVKANVDRFEYLPMHIVGAAAYLDEAVLEIEDRAANLFLEANLYFVVIQIETPNVSTSVRESIPSV